MPKTRTQKEESVASLAERLKKMKAIVIASLSGIPVNDAVALRKQLKGENVDMVIVKKRLFKLALTEAGIMDVPLESFAGTIGVVVGYDDEVMPAKLFAAFQKTHADQVTLFGGVMNNAFIAPEQVKVLSLLPSYDEMVAKTVWTIKAPLNGFVNVLAGTLRSLLYALKAVGETKQ